MTLFILVALAMTLFALAILLPVLWRKIPGAVADLEQTNVSLAREQLAQLDAMRAAGDLDQVEYFERKNELELGLAASITGSSGASAVAASGARGYIVSVVVAVLLPAGAFLLYQQIGAPQSLDPEFIAAQQDAANANASAPSIEELLPRLETHLAGNPEDLQGWQLLGVTYLRMQRFSDADAALGNALALAPDDPDILLQLADAKAMVAGGQLAGAPEALVQQALVLRPNDMRGLWLMGMIHTQKNEHQAALEIWQKLSPLVKDEPDAAREVTLLIAESRTALGLDSNSAEGGGADLNPSLAPVDTSEGKPVAAISVNVSIDPRIADRLQPDNRVYIYAKAINGPPMPLAVLQHTVSELPLQVTLDDSMAMVAGMNLSGFPEVVVGARVSLSGDPVASSGDFFAEIQPVEVSGTNPVSLHIFNQVP